MKYLAQMSVNFPESMTPETKAEYQAKEKEYSQALQRSGEFRPSTAWSAATPTCRSSRSSRTTGCTRSSRASRCSLHGRRGHPALQAPELDSLSPQPNVPGSTGRRFGTFSRWKASRINRQAIPRHLGREPARGHRKVGPRAGSRCPDWRRSEDRLAAGHPEHGRRDIARQLEPGEGRRRPAPVRTAVRDAPAGCRHRTSASCRRPWWRAAAASRSARVPPH